MNNMPEMLINTQYRFWSKVDRRSDDECWNWEGAVSGNGRGQISINNVNYLAHRISYYIYFNKDPGELEVCHECNNGLCVNPNHLFLGTHQENIQHAFDTGLISHIGILHPRSVFMESDIHEIRRLRKTMSLKEIGKIYNVGCPAISKILSGKTWTHVKEPQTSGDN